MKFCQGLSLDLFAAKYRWIVEGNAPQFTRPQKHFFANTFPTEWSENADKKEVFGRLVKTSW